MSGQKDNASAPTSKKAAAKKRATASKSKSPKTRKKTAKRQSKTTKADAPKASHIDSSAHSDEFTENLLKASKLSRKIAQEYMQNPDPLQPMQNSLDDPLNVTKAFGELMTQMALHPEHIIKAQNRLWQDHFSLWQNFARRSMGERIDPLISPNKGDRRFKDNEWSDNQAFDLIKQSYLMTARWLENMVEDVEGLDKKTQDKVSFYTKQITDAFAPTNFIATNPEVLRTTLESKGINLVKGLEHLLEDLERGHGKLAISQTDSDYFEVGRNVATAPGKVIYQNDILQLLQFSPTTKEVHRTPLVIFPPWINKFYILDLREDNSFIRWAVNQGYTVFVVSWVNPGPELGEKTFTDYMHEGIFETLDAIEQATDEREVNTIGYCIGGTLLGCALAYMAEKDDDRIKSATFFTAQLDFEEAGDLKVFIDEDQLNSLEQRMSQSEGVLDASDMSQTFNMLRSNDLIWSFVINNYLLGKDPIRFDLLFWNSDSTRMPKNLHIFYLRTFYLENKLSKGELVVDGVNLDMSKVKTPIFFQSSREDHIAPYRSIWRTRKLFSGDDDVTFMVAGSGHIAGVINPPEAQKYQYWLNDTETDSLEAWWDGAVEHPGSWWPHWEKWLSKYSGDMVPARNPGDGKLTPIEDAPGSYVKVQS